MKANTTESDAQLAGFGVRADHEEVRGPGALPFPGLDAHLERWAAGQEVQQ